MNPDSSRDMSDALETARTLVDDGRFATDLARRVAFRTESPQASSRPALLAYLHDEIGPTLAGLGFTCRFLEAGSSAPFLLAARDEDPDRPTVLIYGHGDCVSGMDAQWRAGLSPWSLAQEGDRLYGRGTADNKGQHSVNIAALAAVIATRGRLGFNIRFLMEMGEETGSVGLREICRQHREALRADVLIASDGPRISAEVPTLFLGARGTVRLHVSLAPRSLGLHSGNWGGLISNPATTLVHAIASMIDARGAVRVEGLRPETLLPEIRTCLRDVTIEVGVDQPMVDANWGEPGLSPAERVYAWNTLEVTGLAAGQIAPALSAIPAAAEAVIQLRFVNDIDWKDVEGIVRRHLEDHGFGHLKVETIDGCNASRTPLDNPWVDRVRRMMAGVTGKNVAVLPNFGGTLPNDIFVEELALPTLWIPHSYPGCNQHAPDEHNLFSLLREAVVMMTGVFWEIGQP